MYCTKCGAQISDSVTVCPYCGQPTGVQPEGSYQPGGNGAYQPGGGAYQPGNGVYQPGGGAYQPGNGAYQPGGNGAYQAGGGYQQDNGAYQSGGGYQQDSGVYQSGGGYQQGGGVYQSGGSYQQDNGAYQAGGGYQQGGGAYQPGGSYQSGGGAYQPGGNTVGTKNTGNRNRIIGIAAVAVVIVVAAFLVIRLLLGGGGYEKPVKNVMEGILDGDAGKILDAMPDEMVEMGMEELNVDSRKELEEMIDEMLIQPMQEQLNSELGDDWDYSYEIVDTEDLSRSELRDFNEQMADTGFDLEAEEGKIVEVELTVRAGEEEESDSMEVRVVKIGRKWYLADFF